MKLQQNTFVRFTGQINLTLNHSTLRLPLLTYHADITPNGHDRITYKGDVTKITKGNITRNVSSLE
ncbi:hypothetical protein E2C01_073602 [Portunus trituberculatus]|uniref:Uncharacterized protein n=1 Tax=Portunus trituberculatus TaxID=210409 RepID=A0A5B7I3G3_PORTR|nr:hypothetical protein [Portunus trituberculatus]